MIQYPPIQGRKTLTGHRLLIYNQLISFIPRLDLMGEEVSAAHVIQAIEALVDAPTCAEMTAEEHAKFDEAIEAYEQALRDCDFDEFG